MRNWTWWAPATDEMAHLHFTSLTVSVSLLFQPFSFTTRPAPGFLLPSLFLGGIFIVFVFLFFFFFFFWEVVLSGDVRP
jgi:hypothetical protein